MAYWNGHAYFAASDDDLREYTIRNGATHRQPPPRNSLNPGATLGFRRRQKERHHLGHLHQNVEWRRQQAGRALRLRRAKLGEPIYTSEQNSQRDRAALATRFVIPVVVNGRVYFGTRSEVEVYGLLK